MSWTLFAEPMTEGWKTEITLWSEWYSDYVNMLETIEALHFIGTTSRKASQLSCNSLYSTVKLRHVMIINVHFGLFIYLIGLCIGSYSLAWFTQCQVNSTCAGATRPTPIVNCLMRFSNEGRRLFNCWTNCSFIFAITWFSITVNEFKSGQLSFHFLLLCCVVAMMTSKNRINVLKIEIIETQNALTGFWNVCVCVRDGSVWSTTTDPTVEFMH